MINNIPKRLNAKKGRVKRIVPEIYLKLLIRSGVWIVPGSIKELGFGRRFIE